MQCVALALCFAHLLACLQVFLLVKRVAETLTCFSHLFLYLLVVFGYLIFDEHIGTIAFL